MMPLLPVVLAGGALYTFYRAYLPFGGRQNATRRQRAGRSKNYQGGKFVNYMPTPMDFDKGALRSMLRDQLRRDPTTRPPKALRRYQLKAVTGGRPAVTWLGHSSMLIQLHHLTILCDPMFSRAASPFQSVGPKRFRVEQPFTVRDLPPVDAVCISHDHYDHLDYATIRALRRTVQMFFVPLGVGAHLERWGVESARITELDWWESATFDGVTFSCAPSRHFSGRTLGDRFATLWC